MKYHLGFWHHCSEDYPVWILSEVDKNMNVLRQIERFWDSSVNKREAVSEGKVSILDVEFDESNLSDEDGEFSNFLVTKTEFERHWAGSNEDE